MRRLPPFPRRALALLLALAAGAPCATGAKEPPGTAESLLRLEEFPTWASRDPAEAFERLRPVVRRGSGDSLAAAAARKLVGLWEMTEPRPAGMDEEVSEWLDLLARSPWTDRESMRRIAARAELPARKARPFRRDAAGSAAGPGRLVFAGDGVWREAGDSLLPVNEAALFALGADRTPLGSARGHLLARQNDQPRRLAWISPEREPLEILLPEAPVWTLAFDDGRAAAAGRDWFQLWRGSTLLFSLREPLGLCEPLRDPRRPALLLLDCPGGERKILRLDSGALSSSPAVLPDARRKALGSFGEAFATENGVELRSLPEGLPLWSVPIPGAKDVAADRGALYVRKGADTLLVLDERSGRILHLVSGVEGELFSLRNGVGALSNSGTVRLLRRDGTPRLVYHAGQALARPPAENGDGLLLPLQNGEWIEIDPDADELVTPMAWRELADRWTERREAGALSELLADEPGNPLAWKELGRNALNEGRKDSAAVAWERAFRAAAPDDGELEAWTALWGASWAARPDVPLPFLSPLTAVNGRVCYVDARDGALRCPAVPGRDSGEPVSLPGPFTSLEAVGGDLYAATKDNRLARIDVDAGKAAASLAADGELLLARMSPAGGVALSQRGTDTSVVRWTDRDLRATGTRLLENDLVPAQLAADADGAAVGYPDGRIVLLARDSATTVQLGRPLVLLKLTPRLAVAAAAGSWLYLVDRQKGRTVGHVACGRGTGDDPLHLAVDGERIALLSGSGHLTLFEKSGQGARRDVPGISPSWAAPLWYRSSLLVPARNALLAVDPSTGVVRELAKFPSPPSSCAQNGDELVCALEGGWIAGLPLQELAARAASD